MNVLIKSALLAALCAAPVAAAPPKKPLPKPSAKPAPKPVAKAAPAVWYDFKGARLGMTLDEWKALEMPGISDMGYGSSGRSPMGRYCSTDKMPNGKEISGFYQSTTESNLGVVECAYGQINRITSDYSSFDRGYVKIGQYVTNDISYKFLDGKLYEIAIDASDNLLSEVMDGLTAKWGPPTSVVNDTTQNKMGATFPHTVKIWINPVATIRVETPWTKIDNMNVIFADTAALARINAAEEKANPSKDKM